MWALKKTTCERRTIFDMDGYRQELRAQAMPKTDTTVDFDNYGPAMHQLVAELFPICRSITGNGVRETLRIIGQHITLTIHEVPSGTKAFDWTVPKEWNIRDAYILDEAGTKIVDFKVNNLHVVSYSVPVDRTVSLAELQKHLYSLEDKPDAIPYVTSYYE